MQFRLASSRRINSENSQPFTGRGLAHFSVLLGPKNVPVPFAAKGDSPIFAVNRENWDSPRERLQSIYIETTVVSCPEICSPDELLEAVR